MPQEKLKKILVSSVVTAILLLTVLLSIMIYQMISIKNLQGKIDSIEAEITELENEKAETEDEIDLWLQEWKIEERQRELGWVYGEDK